MSELIVITDDRVKVTINDVSEAKLAIKKLKLLKKQYNSTKKDINLQRKLKKQHMAVWDLFSLEKKKANSVFGRLTNLINSQIIPNPL